MIRLRVDRLPNGADPKPVWLWWSGIGASESDADRLWHAFLRRFDLEDTFRMIKQTLGGPARNSAIPIPIPRPRTVGRGW